MFFVNIIAGWCFLVMVIGLLYMMYITYLEDKYHSKIGEYLNFKSSFNFYMCVKFKEFPKIFILTIKSPNYYYHSYDLKFYTIKSLISYMKRINSEEHLTYLFFKDLNVYNEDIRKIIKKWSRKEKLKKMI
jgi:hypothetical protein